MRRIPVELVDQTRKAVKVVEAAVDKITEVTTPADTSTVASTAAHEVAKAAPANVISTVESAFSQPPIVDAPTQLLEAASGGIVNAVEELVDKVADDVSASTATMGTKSSFSVSGKGYAIGLKC